MVRVSPLSDRERARARKLFSQGHNKAEIGRIMGRSRRIIWKTLKESPPGSVKKRKPPARSRLLISTNRPGVNKGAPASVELILDAFGD